MTKTDFITKAVEKFEKLSPSWFYPEIPPNQISHKKLKSFLTSSLQQAWEAAESAATRQDLGKSYEKGRKMGFEDGQTALRERLVEEIIKRRGAPKRVGLFTKGYCDGHDAGLQSIFDLLQTSVEEHG